MLYQVCIIFHMKSFERLSNKYSRQPQLARGNSSSRSGTRASSLIINTDRQLLRWDNHYHCTQYLVLYTILHTIKGNMKKTSLDSSWNFWVYVGIIYGQKQYQVYTYVYTIRQQTRGKGITPTLLLLPPLLKRQLLLLPTTTVALLLYHYCY